MSGGHFDYNQYRINDIIDGIERYIKKEKDCLSNELLKEFNKGISILKQAYVYTKRIDWFISGDDGEESFHRHLKEELNKIKE